MPDRLSGLDVTYLTYEVGPMPMNAGGLVVLAPGGDGSGLTARRLADLLAERLHLLRRYRQVAARTSPFGGWVWADDRAFDLSRHIHHHRLEPPGEAAELATMAGRLHTRRLDPGRPLWEAHAIEGLAECRSALLMRWQHAMLDGMSGIEVARVLFDTTPRPAPVGPLTWAAEPRRRIAPGRRKGSGAAPGSGRGDVAADLDRAAEFLDGWIAQLEATRGSRWFREASGVVRFGVAATPDGILREAARRAGVGMDIVFLTVVAGAIAAVLDARGGVAADDVIRTVVPVATAVRKRRDILGNHACYFIVPLPIGAMPPHERLAAVARAVRDARPSEQVATISTMLQGLDRMPDWLVATASRAVSGAGTVDLVASYVRGTRRPLWLAGLGHVSTHPLLPLGPFVRLMIGAANIGGRVGLSVTADEASLPELDFLLDRLTRTASALAD
jgi:WS/DGAT/MGAT family acyltransferase